MHPSARSTTTNFSCYQFIYTLFPFFFFPSVLKSKSKTLNHSSGKYFRICLWQIRIFLLLLLNVTTILLSYIVITNWINNNSLMYSTCVYLWSFLSPRMDTFIECLLSTHILLIGKLSLHSLVNTQGDSEDKFVLICHSWWPLINREKSWVKNL